MKKGCLLFLAVVIATPVTYFLISNHSKKAEIQKEIDSVETVFENAEKDEQASPKARESKPLDLEKTVRLFHILNDGFSTSKNMFEYLQFLATQDYSSIPDEVLDAQKKLLPLYKGIRSAEYDLNETQKKRYWNAITKSVDLKSITSPIAQMVATGGFDPTAVLSLAKSGISSGGHFYDEIQKNDEIEKNAKKALEENREAYLNYLSEYTLLYLKYLFQWNEMCLLRDRAYLAINNGNVGEAIKSLDAVLQKYPTDSESLLLKSFCLLYGSERGVDFYSDKRNADIARDILNQYIAEHPDRAAPALVLLGAYYTLQGDETKAAMLFDQSSVEYPREAETLLDMYNSYNYRNYFLKSKEGHVILEHYKSMMEGFGFYSPNFQKAMIAYNKGDFPKAKEEILRHFFRRGNQDVYDYLISDMKFVEQFMPKILDMIFEEHSFLDLQTYNPTLSFSDKLAVEIENRSDKRLSNVRLFICLHLTDMYAGDYFVKKMETTINNIEPYSKANFGKLQLNYELYGKQKNSVQDVVSARAIIMTDSLIIWVDEDKIKRTNISKNMTRNRFSKATLHQLITGCSYEMKEKEGLLGSMVGAKKMVFHFPRTLVVLNPFFSFGELNSKDAVQASSVVLNGDYIDVSFEKQSSFASKTVPLFVSTLEGKGYFDVTFDAEGNVTKMSMFKH